MRLEAHRLPTDVNLTGVEHGGEPDGGATDVHLSRVLRAGDGGLGRLRSGGGRLGHGVSPNRRYCLRSI